MGFQAIGMPVTFIRAAPSKINTFEHAQNMRTPHPAHAQASHPGIALIH